MAVEPRTQRHLDVADQNRALVELLLNSSSTSPLSLAALRWAGVVALYSAVHHLNAYLWERHRLEPQTHPERTDQVKKQSGLRGVYFQYRRLNDLGWRSRYNASFQPHHLRVEAAVRTDLDAGRTAVHTALGLPL